MNPCSGTLLTLLALAGAPAFSQATIESGTSGTLGEAGCLVIKANAGPKEKARWSGPCKDGYAHGDGKLAWFIGSAPNGLFEVRLDRGLPADGYEK